MSARPSDRPEVVWDDQAISADDGTRAVAVPGQPGAARADQLRDAGGDLPPSQASPAAPTTLGIHAAAALLGAHAQTVRRLARSGDLPGYKLGSDWRFERSQLLRWMRAQRPSARQRTALVLDNQEKVCRALALMLARLGWRTQVATSWDVGLRLAEQELPDVLLLDLLLAERGALRVLDRLRPLRPELPAVLLAAASDSRQLGEFMRYPPLVLLAKPTEQRALERTLRALASAHPLLDLIS